MDFDLAVNCSTADSLQLKPSRKIENSLSYREFKANDRNQESKQVDGEGIQVSCALHLKAGKRQIDTLITKA